MSGHIVIQGRRFEWHECITCGVIFTVPSVVIDQHRTYGGYHCCSNGHQQGWDKNGSEIERVRRERDRLKQKIAEKDDEILEARRATVAETEKVKRLERRAKAGTCPCCKRTFQNMAIHMRKQHPDFAAPTPVLRAVP